MKWKTKKKNYMGFHIQKIWQSVSLGYLKVENKPRISDECAYCLPAYFKVVILT